MVLRYFKKRKKTPHLIIAHINCIPYQVSFYILCSPLSATDKLGADLNIALKAVSLTLLTAACVPGEEGNCMKRNNIERNVLLLI